MKVFPEAGNGEIVGDGKTLLGGFCLRLIKRENENEIEYQSGSIDLLDDLKIKTKFELTGRPDQGKIMENFRIQLTGTMEKDYDIYYRSCVEGYGWLSWAKNGEKTGSDSLYRGIQKLQIYLKKKGESLPEEKPDENTNGFIFLDDTTAKAHPRKFGISEEETVCPGKAGEAKNMPKENFLCRDCIKQFDLTLFNEHKDEFCSKCGRGRIKHNGEHDCDGEGGHKSDCDIFCVYMSCTCTGKIWEESKKCEKCNQKQATFRLKNKKIDVSILNGKCFRIHTAVSFDFVWNNNNGALELQRKNDEDSQLFKLERIDGIWFKFISLASGKALSLELGENKENSLPMFVDKISSNKYEKKFGLFESFEGKNEKDFIGPFNFKSFNSNLSIDLYYGRAKDGIKIQMWESHNNNNQIWYLEEAQVSQEKLDNLEKEKPKFDISTLNGKFYKIHTSRSIGRVWKNENGDLNTIRKNDEDNQIFKFEKIDEWFNIISLVSGKSLCFDIKKKKKDTPLGFSHEIDGTVFDGKFEVIEFQGGIPKKGLLGPFEFKPKSEDNLRIDFSSTYMNDNDKIYLNNSNQNIAQIWYLEPIEISKEKIDKLEIDKEKYDMSKIAGKYFRIYTGYYENECWENNNGILQFHEKSDEDSQIFKIEKIDENYFKISSFETGKYLSFEIENTKNESPLRLNHEIDGKKYDCKFVIHEGLIGKKRDNVIGPFCFKPSNTDDLRIDLTYLDGSEIRLKNFNFAVHQSWYLEEVEVSNEKLESIIKEKIKFDVSKLNGKFYKIYTPCDFEYVWNNQEGELRIHEKQDNDSQIFKIEKIDDKWFKISTLTEGKLVSFGENNEECLQINKEIERNAVEGQISIIEFEEGTKKKNLLGPFKFKPNKAGDLLVDLQYGDTSWDRPIILSESENNLHQLWYLEEIDIYKRKIEEIELLARKSDVSYLNGKTFRIHTYCKTGHVWNNNNGFLQIHGKNNDDSQKFRLERIDGIWYKFISLSSGKPLTFELGVRNNNSPIKFGPDIDGKTYDGKFGIVVSPNGKVLKEFLGPYYFKPSYREELRIDLSGLNTSDGTDIVLWNENAGDNQVWYFEELKN